MPDQAMYLFNNQYHPDVIDKVYSAIRSTTWDHCLKIQGAATQQYLYGGDVHEFTQDPEFNQKMGFPLLSYVHFIPTRLLTGHTKYIMQHFVKGKECFTLREMLQNKIFSDQYIFHLADYIFMHLKCRIVQNGTWLIIPVNEVGGVTQAFMDELMSEDYGGEYTENRWFLEKRPKVSYAYREATYFSLVQDGNRVYLDAFDEGISYYKTDPINDWKICVSDRGDNMPLLRASCASLKHDETTGRAYVELSQNYMDYIKNSTFRLHCFLYHEGHKAGYTISPNYNGPSGYLFTKFNEYIATINQERLKVMAMGPNGDWTTSSAVDKKFPYLDTVAVGFTKTENWIAIPSRTGVSPIYPSNFRVWEYDMERDTIGRMVSFEMTAAFPNLYLYKMQTDWPTLMIEWFRNDHEVDSQYDDFTAGYREYVGMNYYDQAIKDKLPQVIENFRPYACKFSITDFVKHLLLESIHDYRVQELTDLLHETGLHYDMLFKELNEKNRRYRTHVLRMNELPNIYQNIQETGQLRLVSHADTLVPYDLYVDGLHCTDTRSEWVEYNQFITVPKEQIKPDSVLIVDVYENFVQGSTRCPIENGRAYSFLPPTFPLSEVSGSDLVVTNSDGARIPLDKIKYGIYAREIIAQVPFGLIDWEELGISPDDPRIQDRVGVMEGTDFKALTFQMLLPMDISYVHLLTNSGEKLSTNKDGEHLIVKAGDVYLFDPVFFAQYDENPLDIEGNPSPNRFNKRIRAQDLVLDIESYVGKDVYVHNCNVWRFMTNDHPEKSPTVTLINFMGADDPNRLLGFHNGLLLDQDELSGSVPTQVPGDFTITASGTFQKGDRLDVTYLPFPVDRFKVTTDENGWVNLAGSGVMVVCEEDLLFIDGIRYPYEDFKFLSNQIMKAPVPGEVTIIRLCRDSNLFDFKDTTTQSFFDVLYQQSPGFKQHCENLLS